MGKIYLNVYTIDLIIRTLVAINVCFNLLLLLLKQNISATLHKSRYLKICVTWTTIIEIQILVQDV